MTNSEIEALKTAIKEEVHKELAQKNGIGLLSKVALWAGLLVSVINAATLLWKGGELSEQVRRSVADQTTLAVEVQALKSSATGGAKEYMAKNEARNEALEKRLSRVEDIAMTIPSMAADVSVIKSRQVDTINLLNEHLKTK